MATDALTYVAQRVATQTRESKLLELYLILVEGIEVFFPFILLYYLLIYSDFFLKKCLTYVLILISSTPFIVFPFLILFNYILCFN